MTVLFPTRVKHPGSGRVVEVYTNQPGLEFYSAIFMDLKGAKGGAHYRQTAGFTLESQNYPDAVNHVSTFNFCKGVECQH